MFESDMAGHLQLTHQNPDTMHPDAFMPSKSFIEWLESLSTTNKQDKEE